MNSFSFKVAIQQCTSFTASNLAVLFKSALPLIAVHAIIEYFIQDAVMSGSENYIAILTGSLIQFVLLIMFTVAWGGYYLGEIKNISFADMSNWHNIKTAYLITSFKIFLIALFFVVVLFVPLIIINGSYDGSGFSSIVAIFVAIGVFMVFARLSIVFGYTITTGQTSISHIWNITKNNTIKLSLSYFVLVLPIIAVSMFVVRVTIGFPELTAIVGSVLVFLINAIITVYHVNVYKQFSK